MAKESPEDVNVDDEIAELDMIAAGSIQNRNEIVSIYSHNLKRTVEVTRDQVYKYASVMSSNALISDLIGIDSTSLAKHFSREIKMGRAFAKQKLMVRFYNLALYGTNPADRIFALKNWTAMSDQGLKEELEDAEQGADFKIRRPQKPVETAYEIQARNDLADKFQTEKLDPALLDEIENESN